MNLRLVHAVLIFLSAALAVLFGVWCLSLYWRENGVGSLVAADRRVRRVVRARCLRLLVPAQDEDAPMRSRRINSQLPRPNSQDDSPRE